MYHPTSRVLAVLELLQSHERMTGVELARRLEVNARTLRRYITILQDLGIPIVAERGRYGAYELDSGFRLPPMIFTNDEALALEIGLIAATQMGLKEKASAVESARSKLERVMPEDVQAQASALSKTIQLDLQTFASRTSSHVMLVMSRAIQQRSAVRLKYRASNDSESERDLDPYGIACLLGAWYVVGWCHLRNAIRSFRLDRVIEIALTDTHFSRPEDFDALSYVEQSIATLPRKFTFKVVLKTDIVAAQSAISGVLGVLEAEREHVLFRGSIDDLQWFARLLAGVPFEFVVMEPPQLRSALHAHAQHLMRLAELT